MMSSNAQNSDVGPAASHSCGASCLGPLTFHCQVFGDQVSLSRDGRWATRTDSTFKNGLVFSSRPVGIKEMIHLKVLKSAPRWHGGLRVGFTYVNPAARGLPLAPMAIPDLTQKPGHWATAVSDSECGEGTQLKFWVSSGGKIILRVNDSEDKVILKGVDNRRPLWAMIDIYGQTRSIFLQGSEKKDRFHTLRSCPVLEGITPPEADSYSSLILPWSKRPHANASTQEEGMECVVCMEGQASCTLGCGHRCLCHGCIDRIIMEFNRCPLCRQKISSVEGGGEVKKLVEPPTDRVRDEGLIRPARLIRFFIR